MIKKPKVAIFFAIVALLSAMLACNIDGVEDQKTIMDQYYLIDPQSILEAIGQGKTDIFNPVNEEPDVPPSQQKPVDWTQADYLRIAEALHEHVWGETLASWKLNNMDYAIGCDDIDKGLQNGRFEFFKVVNTPQGVSRLVRFIDIDPRSNFVDAWEREYYPKLVDWPVINLANIKIPAEGALQIAERNGGHERRLSVGNACGIDIILAPASVDFHGWLVGYSPSDGGKYFFRLEVNPLTGEYK